MATDGNGFSGSLFSKLNLVFCKDLHPEQGAETAVQNASGSPGTEPARHHQDEPWPWPRWERGHDGGVPTGAVSENTEYGCSLLCDKCISNKFMSVQ